MSFAVARALRRKTTAIRESTRATHESAVQRVIEAFHKNLEQPLDLENMAQIAFASPFHFNRMFRQVAGIPPCQFLYALRLQSAAQLLISTNRSVLDICYEVGYNSLGTFTRRFTELMGLPPTRFRAMARSLGREDFLQELDRSRAMATSDAQHATGLQGRIDAAEPFEGVVLAGLFAEAIPQGHPVAGTLALCGHQYSIPNVPDGEFYLFAAGVPVSDDPLECFANRSLPRGGGQKLVIRDGLVTGSTDIALHPPAVTDPPMLLTLPLLWREFMSGTVTPQQDADA